MTPPRYRFSNLDGSGPHDLATVFKWAVVDRVLGRRRPHPGTACAPQVRPDLEALKQPPALHDGARLTWIGHASWLVQLAGVSLLIDPVFSNSIGPGVRRRVPPALAFSELPSIDAQLVTHNHRDHLDLPSLQRVGRPVIAGLGMSGFFTDRGLDCTELGWWQPMQIRDVTIRFVPAQHWSQRTLIDTNQTLWGGFIIESPFTRIYHSGDTAYFSGFTEIGKRCRPIDAALLPIGAYEPEWFMSKQHLNPEGAVQAFIDLGARELVAMHWGTFQLTDEPMDEPPARLHAEWKRRGIDPQRYHVPAIGSSLIVQRRWGYAEP
jgi:L-ascorbate metabolism protein UlaG (beta-lactamase superfamily)